MDVCSKLGDWEFVILWVVIGFHLLLARTWWDNKLELVKNTDLGIVFAVRCKYVLSGILRVGREETALRKSTIQPWKENYL